MTTAGELADRLIDFTVSTVEALESAHLPGWRIPRTFAGHAVGADVRADVCFTLHHLAEAGVATVAGEEIDAIQSRLLAEVDGAATHTFFSYRIAESVRRAGPFDGNRLLKGLSEAQLHQVEEAVDSSSWMDMLESGALPRNYAAVLARCELGKCELGLSDGTATLDGLVDQLRDVLDSNPRRYLDDSHDQAGRYDIYTADIWLFCEPLAARIGPVWHEGLAAAQELVLAVGGRRGAAIPWGRSTGDLASALTLELAALAVTADGAEALSPQQTGVWLCRAADAVESLTEGFDPDGLTRAHRHRAQDSYRGPARRLQLTFDLLGKMAWAAGALRRMRSELSEVEAAPIATAYPAIDRWLAFEEDRPVGVWSYRAPGAAFVLPLVGAIRSHYLPALHQPGNWEVPVDRDLPTWTPLVVAGSKRYTAGGLPASVDHGANQITVSWDHFDSLDGSNPVTLPGSRKVTIAVEGRTIVVEDQFTFDSVPEAVSVSIPEVAGQSVTVDWACDTPHETLAVTVEGLSEWRSSWSEIKTVHQIDLDPTLSLSYQARVTPLMRVASTEIDHHYNKSLYGPMAHRVAARRTPVGWNTAPDPGFRMLDLLHVHWPEWLAFDDIDAHRRILADLRHYDIPIVWTAHNLTPHQKKPEIYDPIYQLWADAAAGVIHHTAWAEKRMRARYRFSPECEHEVIPHGHFGAMWAEAGIPNRADAEARLGLEPTGLRIGIVGAPRTEKLVQAVLDGVAASKRGDVELVCWSLGPDDRVPDDPRIPIAKPYRGVAPELYATRLAACDVLALVFDAEGEMLATGSTGDAIGLSMPALRSDWGYLMETLGDSGIPVGQTSESIAAAIDGLTSGMIGAARDAAAVRHRELDWAPLAERTADLFERVILSRPRPDNAPTKASRDG